MLFFFLKNIHCKLSRSLHRGNSGHVFGVYKSKDYKYSIEEFFVYKHHIMFHLFTACQKTQKNVHRRSYPYINIKVKNAITEITRI